MNTSRDELSGVHRKSLCPLAIVKRTMGSGLAVSPDAVFYTGQIGGVKLLEGAPVFAVEVRSEGDYGPIAEIEIANKHADYFAAGTCVVWEVDLLSADVIKVYRASDPQNPTVYRRGDMAEAEPAVPGWTMLVAELFD